MTDVEQAITADLLAVLPRVFARDFTVFASEPDEVRDRLNWLVAPQRTDGAALERAARTLDVDHVVLCGMGGSSLYARTLVPYHPGERHVTVLDTTHPDAVATLDQTIRYDRTLFVFASKSGTTAETAALKAFFTDRVTARTGHPSRHLGVITDPNTPFDDPVQHAHVWRADPKVGGRFAAHTVFGVTAAALAGMDVQAHLLAAQQTFRMLAEPAEHNVAVRLAAILSGSAATHVATLAVQLVGVTGMFGLWVEQLVAESLGKHGRGLHVVTLTHPHDADVTLTLDASTDVTQPALQRDGSHVTLRIPPGPDGVADAAAVLMLATALTGRALGVNPFDQPDVAAAKQATGEALARRTALPPACDVAERFADLPAGTPLVLLAYVAPDSPEEATVGACANTLAARHHTTVTVGVGPRYLHSTGQLHKGSLSDAMYLVICPTFTTDVAIPGMPYTFGELITAQAAGDVATLRARGRMVAVTTTDALAKYCAS